MKLSIIVPVLNSHEIVRRQILHYESMNLPDDVQIIFMDDGSDPPITTASTLLNMRIVPTGDKRPWTWAIARNSGARIAQGAYFLMTDLDYIIPRSAIDAALAFTGDKMRFRREFGVLMPDGSFTQDVKVLETYGLPAERIAQKGVTMPPHPNNFVIRKDVFWGLGGYREDLVDRPYPQGEDRHFKREWTRAVEQGRFVEDDAALRPVIYMFPNGQFCKDVDYNPFGLFHELSRKTDVNPAMARTGQTVSIEPVKSSIRKKARQLSVLIPSRNEEFLELTIKSILAASECDTEVIAILDGYWPSPAIADDPRVVFIHHTDPIGQRAAVNEAARLSSAEYVMKLDGHCSVDKGFDRKLITPYTDGRLGADVTTIPRMYNLHAFDHVCRRCGNRYYQGPMPDACGPQYDKKGRRTDTNARHCGSRDFERQIIWQPRKGTITDFARFDDTMQFQYWQRYKTRAEAQGDIADVMSSVGACFFMRRERFLEIEGLDEAHGSWGQFGTEISCKSWLSGGRQVVNKTTWFAHMFRTQPGWTWPYQITQGEIDRAREYSRDLWLFDKWPQSVRPLSWLIDRFAPVPSWHDELKKTENAA
jgi:glycosyltransferase involved in cell wall biosynthesis